MILVPLLTQTVKRASLLAAIAALEVDVIGEISSRQCLTLTHSHLPVLLIFFFFCLAEVLEESEEKAYLIQDLRSRIIQRTAGRGLQQRELLESVFNEIDTDGSGEINRTEFKSLLVQMDIGYSGNKFSKLYGAIDRNADGSLSLAELYHLLFPDDAKQKEVEELGLKVQSRLDRRISELEHEQLLETERVSPHAGRKRLGQITSLKTLSEATWKAMDIPVPQSSETTQQQFISTVDSTGRKALPPPNETDNDSPPVPVLATKIDIGHSLSAETQSIVTRTRSLPPLPRMNRPHQVSTVPPSPLPHGRVFSSPKHAPQMMSSSSADSAEKVVFHFREPLELLTSAAVASQHPLHAESAPLTREPRLMERGKRHIRHSHVHLHPRIEPDPDVSEEASQTPTRKNVVI